MRLLFLRLAEGLGEPVVVGGRAGFEIWSPTLRTRAVLLRASVARLGAAVVQINLALHGKRNPVALEIDLDDGNLNFLSDFNDL